MARITVLTKMIWLLILCQVVAANEDDFSSAYFITWENRRLAGHLVKKIESTSFMSCSHSCLRHSWCTSTNFKESVGRDDKGTCELNKHEFAPINDDAKLVDQPGYSFTMMLKGCLMTGCLNGGSCLFGKKKGTFTCSCKRPWIGDKCEVKRENWKKINDDPVCFKARDDSYGSFNITESGLIFTFKLVHRSGALKCARLYPASYWGCTHWWYGDMRLAIFITFPNKTTLLPAVSKGITGYDCVNYPYKIDGVDINATELVFNNLTSPLSVTTGQEFQIWFGEDLRNCHEDDNSGQTCADVYAWYI